MNPIVLTVVLAVIIFGATLAVIINEIRKKAQGKPSCSCGGSCSSCPVGSCQYAQAKKEEKSQKREDVS